MDFNNDKHNKRTNETEGDNFFNTPGNSNNSNINTNHNSKPYTNNSNSGSTSYKNTGGYNKVYNKFYRKPEEDFDEENPILYRAYVGTGNRETPPKILDQMKQLSQYLAKFNYTLRTGGFDGPEEAFESGADKLELHIPWKDFNKKESKLYFNTKQSLAIARMFHPAFDGLKAPIQAFLAKNVRMLLGKDLKSPALFVICWSEDGAETNKEKTFKTGNMGHVLAIASSMKIPVFNLARPDAEQRLKKHLDLSIDT